MRWMLTADQFDAEEALRLARLAERESPAAAEKQFFPEVTDLLATEEAGHGLAAFLTKQPAVFVGR